MSSTTTGKISMALDDIIEKNRSRKTQKREKKITPIKKANNTNQNNYRRPNQNFRGPNRFNSGRKFNGNNNNGNLNRGGNNIRRGRGGRGSRRLGFRSRNNNDNGGRRGLGLNRRNDRQGANQRRRQRPSQADPRKTKCRIRISNLSQDVTNQELFEIFNEVGQLKRCGIHWDKLGKSKGTADLEYYNSEDAQKAVNQFNNAECGGKNLHLEFLPDRQGSQFTTRGGVRRRRIKTVKQGRRMRNKNTPQGNRNQGGNNRNRGYRY